MKEQFRDWYIYNSEANLKLIEGFAEISKIPEKVLAIFSHILLAHKIWLQRMELRENISEKPWDLLPSEDFSAVNSSNLEKTLGLLKEQDLSKKIEYTNTRGKLFGNSLEEILFHILTHSSYHRGQIAILLRQENFDPPLTDYIFYKR